MLSPFELEEELLKYSSDIELFINSLGNSLGGLDNPIFDQKNAPAADLTKVVESTVLDEESAANQYLIPLSVEQICLSNAPSSVSTTLSSPCLELIPTTAHDAAISHHSTSTNSTNNYPLPWVLSPEETVSYPPAGDINENCNEDDCGNYLTDRTSLVATARHSTNSTLYSPPPSPLSPDQTVPHSSEQQVAAAVTDDVTALVNTMASRPASSRHNTPAVKRSYSSTTNEFGEMPETKKEKRQRQNREAATRHRYKRQRENETLKKELNAERDKSRQNQTEIERLKVQYSAAARQLLLLQQHCNIEQ